MRWYAPLAFVSLACSAAPTPRAEVLPSPTPVVVVPAAPSTSAEPKAATPVESPPAEIPEPPDELLVADHGADSHVMARVNNAYRRRITAFFAGGWKCRPSIATTCSPAVQFTLDAQKVTGFALSEPCGLSAVDDAAKRYAATKVGQAYPPPPRQYPDIAAPDQLTVRLMCR